MTNKDYFVDSRDPGYREKVYPGMTLSTSYWYADSITWDSSTNRYQLVNPYQVSSQSDFSSLIGKYTFRSDSQTYSLSSVFYIAGIYSSTMYYISISRGNSLNDYEVTSTYGDSFTKNGNGTYTINNPSSITNIEWFSNYSNVSNKYICKNSSSGTCNDLWYIYLTSSDSFHYLRVAENYKYANSFTYDGDNYILDSTNSMSVWNLSNNSNGR